MQNIQVNKTYTEENLWGEKSNQSRLEEQIEKEVKHDKLSDGEEEPEERKLVGESKEQKQNI